MAAHVFHVQFGLNETALTRALESERYDLAEKLIRETTSASYLDEGCYQRTPLYIVLCGRAETFLSSPRNFFLTKLLIERGGDVNLRIPETYPGAEFMNPGKSPLELVTNFYNELTAHDVYCCRHVPWKPKRDVVIGFDKQRITIFSELLQQVLDLTLIMLESGGDVNVRGVSGVTLLHRTVVGTTTTDDRLLYLLCDSGADYNATDRSGMTPLTAACSQLSRVEIFKCDHRSFVQRQVPYLLSLDNIQVDTQDQRGRTALFYCMVWPDTQCALMLLRQPCDPCLKATVLLDTGASGSFSPLFACLGTALAYEYKRASLALLVDSGYFTKPAIIDELWEAVEDVARWRHLKAVGPQLVCDMFGVTSTTLKQLCSRVVLGQVTRCQGETTELSTHSEQRSNIDDLTSHGLTALVKTLNVPETTMQCFETELLAAQLCKAMRSHDWNALNFIDDPSSDSDESDAEYW